MLKNKLFVGLFIGLMFGLFTAQPASASVLSIQSLPTYVNTNSFKLSCTSDGGIVQFSVSRHGASFVNFGPAIDTSIDPCVVQVDSSVVNEQTDYVFSANGLTTSTIYDASGPSPVSGYYKERIDDGMYKLHFHTPNDGDFSHVIIYRGETGDFSADAGHKIAEVNGGANSDMTYDDHFTPDAGKTYYYDIRAVDKAGNSSGLAGDGTGTTYVEVLGESTSPTPSSRVVTNISKEKATGSILGAEASPEPSPQASGSTEVVDTSVLNTSPGVLKWILTHKKISVGIVILVLALVSGIRYFIKKSN